MDEARAIFGEDFNFDDIETNEEMNDGDEDEDDEIDDEIEDEMEDNVEPEYDEEGRLIEDVNKTEKKPEFFFSFNFSYLIFSKEH